MSDHITDNPDSIQSLEERLVAWHRHAYPHGININATFIKAAEEFGELAEALLGTDNAIEEAADIAIVLTHLVRGLGGNLFAAMQAKLAVIERRLEEEGK